MHIIHDSPVTTSDNDKRPILPKIHRNFMGNIARNDRKSQTCTENGAAT